MNAETNVRRAQASDLERILQISNWAIQNTVASFRTMPETLDELTANWECQSESYPWLVAFSDGTVVGHAVTSAFLGRCGAASAVEVTVYVDPDHVGKGVGKALYAQLLRTLTAQGFQTAVAVIVVPNPASERLHERYGFRRMGVLSGVGWKFDQWYDVAYWQLALQARTARPRPILSVAQARGRPRTDDIWKSSV